MADDEERPRSAALAALATLLAEIRAPVRCLEFGVRRLCASPPLLQVTTRGRRPTTLPLPVCCPQELQELGDGDDGEDGGGTWHVPAARLRIRQHLPWSEFVECLASDALGAMGLPGASLSSIRPRLSELVLRRPPRPRSGVDSGPSPLRRVRATDGDPRVVAILWVLLPTVARRTTTPTSAGGELIVHSPSGDAVTWSPTLSAPTEDSTLVRYAVVAGGCDYELGPVTSGHQVALVYHLVVGSRRSPPQALLPPPLSETPSSSTDTRLDQALGEYFRSLAPTRRTTFYAADPSTWSPPIKPLTAMEFFCRSDEEDGPLQLPGGLAYFTRTRVVEAPLGFATLASQDRPVAQHLGAFCAASRGEYALFLTAASGWSEPRRLSHRRHHRRFESGIDLCGPWLRPDDSIFCPKTLVKVVAHTEMIAVPNSERRDEARCPSIVEALGLEGWGSWRQSAALLVVTRRTVMELASRRGPEHFVPELVALDPREPRTRDLAVVAFSRVHDWSSCSRLFRQCLEFVAKLDDVEVFVRAVGSVRFHGVQSQLRRLALHFGWDRCVPDILNVVTADRGHLAKSRINLALSLVDNTQSTDHEIAEVLNSLQLELRDHQRYPRSPGVLLAKRENLSVDVERRDLDRLLPLAFRASPTCFLTCLILEFVPATTVVAPSLLAFTRCVPATSANSLNLLIAIHLVIDRIQREMPRSASWALPGIEMNPTRCGVLYCDMCMRLYRFLASDSEQSIRYRRVCARRRRHIEKFVLDVASDKLRVRVRQRGALPLWSPGAKTVIVTKRPVNAEKRREAMRIIRQLKAAIPKDAFSPRGSKVEEELNSKRHRAS